MANTIIDGTNFDINSVMYTNPKANDKGGKSINILNLATKTGLRLSTPLMMNWGAGEYVDKATGVGNGKWEVSLQFPQVDYASEECTAFFNNMRAFEEKIKHDAVTNSVAWLGKKTMTPEIIDVLFTPMLKYTKIKGTTEPDYNKMPTIRLKLPQWEDKWKFEIYDEEGDALFPSTSNPNVNPLDYLKKGSTIACIIQCGGIWFTNGKFTVTWKLVQAVVQKPKDSIQGKCMIKLKSNEKEKLQKASPGEETHDDCAGIAIVVEDSDEEPDETSDVVVSSISSSVTADVAEKPTAPPAESVSANVQSSSDGTDADKPKKMVKKIIKKV